MRWRIVLGLLLCVLLMGGTVLCLCTVGAALVWLSERSHDRYLMELEAEFQELEHPRGTSSEMKQSALGLLDTGGNACRYFVAELRRYSGRSEYVESFYIGAKVAGYFVEVDFPEGLRFADSAFSIPREFDELSEWGIAESSLGEKYYLVYIRGGPDGPGLDPRCN